MRRSIWLVFALLLILTACQPAGAASLPYVDLTQREPLPAAAQAEVVPLRIAVAAIISPKGTAESYGALADYLGDALGRPVKLVQRRTYAEVNDLIAAHNVDVAFVCTSAYVSGSDEFGMELLAAPQIDGQRVYYSRVIVPRDSTADDVSDLRNKVFAFTDPMSHSGRVYPTYLVQQLGETPDTFFARTFFTYSHDRAIHAVAEGVADGAAVDSLVLDNALERDASLRDQIKVIHQSPAYGIPPVVVPPRTESASPQQRALLQEALLTMHTDAEGRRILSDLGIDKFVPIKDSAYDSVRALWRATGGIR